MKNINNKQYYFYLYEIVLSNKIRNCYFQLDFICKIQKKEKKKIILN